MIYLLPKSTSLWIQTRTMRNLKMNQEPLLHLNFLYRYCLWIKDQQSVHRDQLPAPILTTKTVSIARWVQCTKSGLWKNSTLSRSPRSNQRWALGNDVSDTQVCRSSQIILQTTVPCVQRSLYLNEMTDNFGKIKVEVPCGRAAGTSAKLGSRAREEASAQERTRILQTLCWSKTLGVQILDWQRGFWSHRPAESQAEKVCDRTRGAHHEDGQTWQLPWRISQMGIERFSKTDRRNINRRIRLASTRPGFRKSRQLAASKSWNIFHIGLKTAFLQAQSYGVNRDVACQLPPEARHPPENCCKIKETCIRHEWCSSTLVEHPWQGTVQIWHGSHASRSMLLCVVLNADAWANLEPQNTLHSGTIQATSQFNRVRDQKEVPLLSKCWILLEGVQLQENPWQEC